MACRLTVLVSVVFFTRSVLAQDALQLPDQELPLRPEIKRNRETPFDHVMIQFMKEQELVGAALAVTRNSKLVYARGFGYADISERTPVEPTTLFRIASISKPITSVAIMKLVQQRKLDLDDKVLEVLEMEPFLEDGTALDPRMKTVTIRHLLNHSAGWQRDADPMASANQRRVQANFGLAKGELRPHHMVKYMLGQPLDFEPGSKMAYSNLGYCFLGRVVAKVSGQSYEEYVQQHVFAPLGVTNVHIGARHSKEDEVSYYSRHSNGERQFVDGGKHVAVEVYESHGGWVISMVDLARFATALDKPRTSRMLSQTAVESMFSRPTGRLGASSSGEPRMSYYAFGWEVRLNSQGRTTWHSGSLHIGTSSMLYRRRDGMNWAIAFNVRDGKGGQKLRDLIQQRLHKAADEMVASRNSSQRDLFRTTYKPQSDSPTIKPDFRTWTSANGKFKVLAIFVKFADGSVHLKRKDGTTLKVPLSRISDTDRTYVRAVAARSE